MKYYYQLVATGLVLVLFTFCGRPKDTANEDSGIAAEPTQAQASEWIVLFDGSNLDAWKGYMTDVVGSNWRIEKGVLIFEESDPPDKQDLITREEFENFELELEWNISEGGNSGIFYLVKESDEYSESYLTAPEMQVIDNERHPDGKNETHRAGDLYDLISCSTETVKPAGEWNKVKIIKNGSHLEQWLNGTMVVEVELWTDDWYEMVSNSKFAGWEGFAKYQKGRIGLQDHQQKVSFQNIRIKKL